MTPLLNTQFSFLGVPNAFIIIVSFHCGYNGGDSHQQLILPMADDDDDDDSCLTFAVLNAVTVFKYVMK